MTESTEAIQEEILLFLEKNPGRRFKSKEMARRLGYRSDKQYEVFRQALRGLQDSGKLHRARGKEFSQVRTQDILKGKLHLSRQGYGFVTADDSGEEIFVPAPGLGNATDGDTVEISVSSTPKRRKDEDTRREGQVVRVITRSRSSVVGVLEKSRLGFVVIPDDKRVAPRVAISARHVMGAKERDKVLVEIDSWGKETLEPEGRVVEVLGKSGELSAEILSVAREFRLPLAFPREVLAAAESLPAEIPAAELRRRVDFRSRVCFTIDPEDAKDFDDAVSLEPIEGGLLRLGVHIADVSYYVRENDILDREALQRGTSVYFPNGVIPMLPERLSTNLCSLRQDEDRPAYSVFINLTTAGVVKGYEIAESVIRSARRFTYEEVQSVIEGDSTGLRKSDSALVPVIRSMFELSKVLTRKRMKEGSIDFDSAEAKFQFDEKGKPTAIIKKVRHDSNRLVEEFMLLANQMVAKHIGLARKEEHAKPFVYRVHDSPDPDRIRELSNFVQKFGFKLPADGGVSSKALQKLLQEIKGSDVENVINEVALRSMAKAIYSERNIGHYGLAFDYYTHFTSPIRRYPDLVVHRLLKRYAAGMALQEREQVRKTLPAIAKQASETERLALEAERAAVKVMQVEYMKRHLGDEFQAVVSGVTHFGMFVEVNDLLVEGLVHVRDMGGDYFVYDEKKYALVGRRTGRQYRLGDTVSVKVVKVNPEGRQIDFSLVELEEKSGSTRRAHRR
ncbi:MAG TPA: ribonuclease R [Bacteroidota bacterium]|nr:ribonuclease R [Bacteroidota bacterium]